MSIVTLLLLLVAMGVGIFFYRRKKSKPVSENTQDEEEEVLEEEEEEEMDAADVIAAEKKADIAIQKTKRKVNVAASMTKKKKAEAAAALAAKKRAEAEVLEAKRKKDAQAALIAKKKAEAAAALAAKKKAEAEAYKRKLAKAREEKRKAEEAARKEAARKAREEAARKAREEAARKARAEAARKAREEAARKAREEAARKAREEAARKARAEAARKAHMAEMKKRRDAQEKARKEAQARAYRERVRQKWNRDANMKAKKKVIECDRGSWNGVKLMLNAYQKAPHDEYWFSNMRNYTPKNRDGDQNITRRQMIPRTWRFGDVKLEVKTKRVKFGWGRRINSYGDTKTHIYFGSCGGYRGRRCTWREKKTYDGHLFVDGHRLMLRKAKKFGRPPWEFYLKDVEIAKFSNNKWEECAIVAVSTRRTKQLLFVQSNNNEESYDLATGKWVDHPYDKCLSQQEWVQKFCKNSSGKYMC